MLVKRSVDGCPLDPNDDLYERSKDISHAEHFLKTHKEAKILVIIDTHCLDNGSSVWTGATAHEYRACSLLEVELFGSVLRPYFP